MAPLSHDELLEIFSRLPAKAIYKFTSTSKSFSKLPKETYFASKQTQNSLLRDDTCFFIQPDITQSYNVHVEFHPLPGEELSSGVPQSSLEFLSNSAKILSSSNGLILCRATGENEVKLFITNPATQSWLPIPTPGEYKQNGTSIGAVDLKIVLECDDKDDYMVYLFYDNLVDWSSSNLDCKVYHSNEGVWKSKQERFFTGSRKLKFDMPVHHRGAVHFISDCFPSWNKKSPYFRPYIMSYNYESGNSRMLRVPKEARKGSHDLTCDMGIFKWGKATDPNQSICLVRLRKHVFTIWTLTHYETSEWRRVLKIRVKAMVKDHPIIRVKGYAVLNGDLLVFATEKKVYGCGLNDMRIQEICDHEFDFNVLRFTSYKDTLRTFGTGAGTLPLSLHTCGTRAGTLPLPSHKQCW